MHDILEISNIIFIIYLFYNFMCRYEVFMKNLSKLYCKYVINILCKNLNKYKKNEEIHDKLYDDIYNSYLKLEEILKEESIN